MTQVNPRDQGAKRCSLRRVASSVTEQGKKEGGVDLEGQMENIQPERKVFKL